MTGIDRVKLYKSFEQLVVVEGTRAYQAWSRPPALSTEFYFYNLLNPEQFLKEHAKPILEEKGPYSFRFS